MQAAWQAESIKLISGIKPCAAVYATAGAGFGVKATTKIHKGQVIGVYGGVLGTWAKDDPKAPRSHLIGAGGGFSIDGRQPQEGMIGSRCNTNIKSECNADFRKEHTSGLVAQIVVVATKTIAEGHVVYVPYNDSHVEHTIVHRAPHSCPRYTAACEAMAKRHAGPHALFRKFGAMRVCGPQGFRDQSQPVLLGVDSAKNTKKSTYFTCEPSRLRGAGDGIYVNVAGLKAMLETYADDIYCLHAGDPKYVVAGNSKAERDYRMSIAGEDAQLAPLGDDMPALMKLNCLPRRPTEESCRAAGMTVKTCKTADRMVTKGFLPGTFVVDHADKVGIIPCLHISRAAVEAALASGTKRHEIVVWAYDRDRRAMAGQQRAIVPGEVAVKCENRTCNSSKFPHTTYPSACSRGGHDRARGRRHKNRPWQGFFLKTTVYSLKKQEWVDKQARPAELVPGLDVYNTHGSMVFNKRLTGDAGHFFNGHERATFVSTTPKQVMAKLKKRNFGEYTRAWGVAAVCKGSAPADVFVFYRKGSRVTAWTPSGDEVDVPGGALAVAMFRAKACNAQDFDRRAELALSWLGVGRPCTWTPQTHSAAPTALRSAVRALACVFIRRSVVPRELVVMICKYLDHRDYDPDFE